MSYRRSVHARIREGTFGMILWEIAPLPPDAKVGDEVEALAHGWTGDAQPRLFKLRSVRDGAGIGMMTAGKAPVTAGTEAT